MKIKQQMIPLEDKLVLLLVPDIEGGAGYGKMLNYLVGLELVQEFQTTRKICYVSIYKSHDFLIKFFQKNNVNTNGIYFIDCVSSYLSEPRPMINCEFITAPYDLDQISKAI